MTQIDRIRRLAEDTALKVSAMRSANSARVTEFQRELFIFFDGIAVEAPEDRPALAMAAAAAIGQFIAKYAPRKDTIVILETLKECVEVAFNEYKRPQTQGKEHQ